MKRTIILAALLAFTIAKASTGPEKLYSRYHKAKGVSARITIWQQSQDTIALEIVSGKDTTRETLRGKSLNPLWMQGAKRQMFFGGFGESELPLLIFSTNNPDRLGDATVVCYQVTKYGGLIGHKLATEARTGYGETMSGGRYQLAAIDAKLGAIYSVAYQQSDFGSFRESYEKLRVRQYIKSLGAFIEADQGFLRDRRGKVIGSGDFRTLSERTKKNLFLANIRSGGFPLVAPQKSRSLAKN